MKNLIKSLKKPDDNVTEDVMETQEVTTYIYKTLYTSEGVHDMDRVLNHVPQKVTKAMNDILTAPYTKEDVKKTLDVSNKGTVVTQRIFLATLRPLC
jgi:hypothetical protein